MGSLVVEHEPASAALVRDVIRDDLAGAVLSAGSIDDVLLVATELLGNAVQHTDPDDEHALSVEWGLDRGDGDHDTITVRVGDSSARLPARRQAAGSDTTGRGLAIVAALADSWGSGPCGEGKCVWARVPVH